MSRRGALPWKLRAAFFAVGLVAFGCGRLDPTTELAAAAKSLAARNYNEAAVRLNSVVQVQPDNAEARKLRGELALLLGDYAAAAADLERARALGSPLQSIALGLADAWTNAGQADKALGVLDAAAAPFAGDPMYWALRTEALLNAGRIDEAEQALATGERAGDAGPRARIARARTAFARNDARAAEESIEQGLAATPDDPRLLVARAEIYVRSSRLSEAVGDLSRAADLYREAALKPREVAALLTLVQVHIARNDLDAAGTAAARLAQEAPGAILASYVQGLVAYRRGKFDEAAGLIQPLVNAAPDTIQFRSLLGAIHLARGNLGQAEQQLLSALATSPRDPAAIKLLAETRLRQQRPEAALATLRAVEDAAAQDPQIGFLRGLANLLSGKTEQGVLYLQQAASLDPTNELLKLQLARAYLVAGRAADASVLLKDSFVSGPAGLEAGLMRLFADVHLAPRDDGPANDLLAQFPREPRALTAVGMYFQLQGENQRARELFEQAAKLETNGATARLFVAAALVQEGRRQEAEALLTRLVSEQPDNPQVLTALAELLASRGAVDEAATLLDRAVTKTTSASPRLALAQLRIRQGNFAVAKQQIDEAARVAPDNPEVVAVQGLLALAQGRAADAVTSLQKAEAQLPNRLGISLALARAQLATTQPDAARATVLRMLAVVPASLPLRFMLGEAELALGNAVEASSIAAQLKAEYPDHSGGYLLEGDSQIAERRYSAAADSFGKAFAREATWPLLARLVGGLQLAGRPADALQATERWVAANPQHVQGALAMATLLQGVGRNDEALRAYESVLSRESDNLVALNNAAWLSNELGRPDALALAERAHRLAPDSAPVLDTLGWILLAKKREQEAIAHLSRAAELAPRAPEIRYHFAKGLAAVGRSAEAHSVLTALLAEGVEFEHLSDARRLRDSL